MSRCIANSLFVVALGAASFLFAHTDAPAAEPVPAELQGWQSWVLHGNENSRCPVLMAGGGGAAQTVVCTWPQPLSLQVDGRGGRFSQSWDVYAEGWVVLPGDEMHWPRDVRVDGRAAALVLRGGRPQLQLAVGRHAVTGAFQWDGRPEQLVLPADTGIVLLTVDGQRVARPERPGEAISFGRAAQAATAARLETQVYRLLTDGIPAVLTTRVRLQVAGEAREEVLGQALPAGFTPLSLNGGLPARLDADGRLRVQVRAGSFELQLVARANSVAQSLRRPPLAAAAPANSGAPTAVRWPREEVWSFEGQDRLRVANAEGADGIDPVQANVPPEWRALPAFRMAPDSTLTISERSRGLANADENRLTLTRQLWLDFNHDGYTAVDTLRGQMRQDWRLDLIAPFRLESARSGEDNLLITRGSDAQRTGIELRAPQLDLRTLARIDGSRRSLPAAGWDTRFESVSGVLHLPAGHRLLGALGPDSVDGSWWSGWGLWSLFGIILVVAFTLRVINFPVALVALLALLLTYQESPAYIWLWGNALLAIGLYGVVPAGRLQTAIAAYRTVSIGLLAVALLPLLWGQVRLAIYPQLEATNSGYSDAGDERKRMALPEAPAMEESDAAAAAGAAAADAAPTVENAAVPVAPPMAVDRATGEVVATAEAQRRDAAVTAAPATSSVYGLNVQQALQRYAPGTQIQTGPGVPGWRYVDYAYSWSGPVEPDAELRFIFIGPLLLALWRIAGVLLLALWFYALLQRAFDVPVPPTLGRLTAWLRSGRPAETATAAAAGLLLCAFAPLLPTSAQAATTPDPALLTELRSRLLEAPRCQPDCADITRAVVRVNGDRLDVQLDVSALALVSVAVPSADTRWQIDALSVDGAASLAVRRATDGSLWVPLGAGARVIRMSGRVLASDAVQLAFPQRPRVVEVSAPGWDVAGVNESRLISGVVELARRQQLAVAGVGKGADTTSAVQFPAFVRVHRNFSLDLDWSVNTVVERLAPERAAVTVEVPLLAGESVLTEGIRLRDGKIALVGLETGQPAVSWSSGLARRDTLRLELPAEAARSEVWTFTVNPQWRIAFKGMPAVLPDDLNSPQWVFTFFARPGESLQVDVSRPEAVAGRTLAIDSVLHERSIGARSSDETLQFNYRSTQGGRHSIQLPADARVASVELDGAPVQLRPERGELSIGLLPGEHSVAVQWQSAQGAALLSSGQTVDLRAPASNLRTRITLPDDRWPLFVLSRGAGFGPAVLYWGELVALLALAWVLGRWSFSPLRTHEWLLLGLGLSTQSWMVFATVAIWLFALRWRQGWSGTSRSWLFNVVQLALVFFTVITLSTLVFSGIQYGFLSSPEMGVVGDGSGGNVFAWFRDQTASALPEPLIISVPLWVYKTLIFLWALWIAMAMTRWLRFAWQAWSSGGYWRGRDNAAPTQ